jgi:hypothetical protein
MFLESYRSIRLQGSDQSQAGSPGRGTKIIYDDDAQSELLAQLLLLLLQGVGVRISES